MPTINTNSNNRSYTITGLTNNVPYRVRVAAVNAIGTGPFTSYVTGTPSAIAIDPYYYDNTLLMHMDMPETLNGNDTYSSNVSLLLSFNDFSDSSIIPKSLNVNRVTVSPSYKKFGTGSAYFDGGCGSYITVNENSDFGFGTGDFTIEMWIYPLDSSGYRTLVTLNSYSDGLLWRSASNTGDTLYITNSGYNTGPYPYNVNEWNHAALVRSNGTLTVYVNGVSTYSTSNSGNLQSSRYLYIGGSPWTGGCDNFYGYMDDLRITKGVARYTSNFSPNTTQFSIQKIFIDSSAYNRDLIYNASISNTASKFGGYAGYFNGSSAVRSAGTDIWQLGTNDFTVESWFNPSLLTNSRTIAGTYDGSNGGWRLMVGSPVGGTPSYGPQVDFTATNYGTEVDVIIPGVLEITRNNNQGIYNSAIEGSFERYSSPANTLWNRGGGWSNVCDFASRSYGVWVYNAAQNNPPYMVNAELIMKHVPTNRYWLIKFTNWQPGNQGGAFAYTRKEILGCVTDSSVVEFRNGDSSVITKNTATPITTGEWHHIAAVRSSGSLSLYLDGQQLGSSNSFTSNITRNNSYGLSIGAYTLSNGSSSDYFNGYLDDLRITKGVPRYLESFVSPISSFPNNGPAPTVPSEPLSLAVSEDQGIVSLSWNRPLVPKTVDNRAPISYYGVEYSSNAGSSWTEHSVSNNDQALLTRNISGLPDNTPYSFRVRAQNSVGFGNYSSTANISTLNNAPSGVNAIPDDNQAFVSWTAPTPNNSSTRDYAIQYSSNTGSSWTTFSHSPSTDTLINVTGLNNSSDYVFRVAAVNLAGTGVYSSNSSSIRIAPRTDNLYNKTRILLHLDSN